MATILELEGQKLIAFNGGPQFKLNESFSLMIDCQNQEEVDYYWNSLVQGGAESMCGWLRDKYGLWWQVVPTVLMSLIGDKDPAKAQRAMHAMLKMKKMDIATLEKAHRGE